MPYRNSTTSEPSRSTASPTTIASAVSGLAPSLTAWPTVCISTAISRPCRAIQALCHISMTTATPRMLALNNSWPGALEGLRNDAGEAGDQAGAEHAAGDAEIDPAPAAGDATRRRHHDADDQAGFDDFAKNDDERAEHGLPDTVDHSQNH